VSDARSSRQAFPSSSYQISLGETFPFHFFSIQAFKLNIAYVIGMYEVSDILLLNLAFSAVACSTPD
jgi:hypothetical protein